MVCASSTRCDLVEISLVGCRDRDVLESDGLDLAEQLISSISACAMISVPATGAEAVPAVIAMST
jgi:hypothetical protein